MDAAQIIRTARAQAFKALVAKSIEYGSEERADWKEMLLVEIGSLANLISKLDEMVA